MRQVLGPGALGRPRGIGWRGRWEGGSGWEIHVNPWLIHVNVWQNPLQYCKVISLQVIKINGKKEKAEEPEIKLPTSIGPLKKQESSRKTSTADLLTVPKTLTMWITANWKIRKEMGVPDRPTCLLRNLYAGQEATDWFQIRKGVRQGCMLSPCLFNLYAEYIMWNAGLEEAQAGIKIAGRNINNLRYADDTTLVVESKEELKSLLTKVKE